MENNKKNRYPKNRFIFGMIIILLINAASISQIATTTGDVEWDAAIDFDEPGGGSDCIVFGEAEDASDGPPHDDYDMPKPPSPPYPPYVRSWFNDGLSPPYTQLLKDYRHYPDIQKIWNLSIQWVPDDGAPTNVTISWDTNDIENSEYDSVVLCDNAGSPLTDMFVNDTYEFTCPANTLQNFKIICSSNQDPVANDDYAVVQEYSTDNQIDVLDNDYDDDGDDLEIIDVTTPSHGTATYDEDYVYYTPEAGYSGTDTFDYTITDNNGSSGVTARVHVIITKNKPPETPNTPSGSTFGYFNTLYEYTASTTDPDMDQIYYMFYWGDDTYSDWLGPFDSGDPAVASHTWTVGGNYGVKVKAKDVHNAETGWSDSIIVHIAAPMLEIRQINGGISKISAKIKNNGDSPASQVNWRVSIKGGILGGIDVTAGGTISSLDINEEAIIDTDDASIVGLGLVDITVTAETAGASAASDTVKGLVLLYIVFVIS